MESVDQDIERHYQNTIEVDQCDVDLELTELIDKTIMDCKDDATVDAFIKCEKTWIHLSAIEPVSNVHMLSQRDLYYRVNCLNKWILEMQTHIGVDKLPEAEINAATRS